MSFWSSEKLQNRLSSGGIIAGAKELSIKHGAYELNMGGEYFVTSSSSDTKQTLEMGEQISIPPGQMALLITEEIVSVPNNVIAFISMKYSIKCRGLVNISGFHVDPGFKGRIKFSVYNAGSKAIVLERGRPAFLIWFSDLDRPTRDYYNGEHKDQQNITARDVQDLQGEIASPSQLQKDIKTLEHTLKDKIKEDKYTLEKADTALATKISNLKMYTAGLTALIMLVVGAFIKELFSHNSQHDQLPADATQQTKAVVKQCDNSNFSVPPTFTPSPLSLNPKSSQQP